MSEGEGGGQSEGAGELTVDEFAEYCRTQAGLLSGSVERMREDAGALLDEIDEGAAEVRARLDARGEATETAASPSADPDAPDADLSSIAELESELEEKQAVAEAKRARIEAFTALAEGYVELAAELASEVDESREAMDRVVRFEADRDAPAYFDDRETLYEAAARASAGDGDGDAGESDGGDDESAGDADAG